MLKPQNSIVHASRYKAVTRIPRDSQIRQYNGQDWIVMPLSQWENTSTNAIGWRILAGCGGAMALLIGLAALVNAIKPQHTPVTNLQPSPTPSPVVVLPPPVNPNCTMFCGGN